MPVVSVREQWDGRDAELSDGWDRRYTRVFQVRTDDNADGQLAVLFAPGIPRVWDFFASPYYREVDVLAVCRRVTPAQDAADPRLWRVTCEYSTRSAQPPAGAPGWGGPGGSGGDAQRPGGGGGGDDPTLRPPEVEWDAETVRVPFVKGFSLGGAAGGERVVQVMNTAGQKFDPPPEIEMAYPVFRLSRYESLDQFTAEKARKYSFALNADPFLGANPGEAQMLPVKARIEWVGAVPFWRASYAVRFVPEGWLSWDVEILDAGRYKRGPNPGDEPVPIFDETTRQPVTEDWPLDGTGYPLPRDEVLADGAVYLTFHAYRKQPFAPLNLV